MQGSTYYTFAIGITSGLFARSFFDVTFAHISLVLLIGIATALVWRLRDLEGRPLFLTSVCMIGIGLGVIRLDVAEHTPSPLLPYVGTEVVIEGRVHREPDVRERSQHLYVREDVTEELVLVITDRYHEVGYGDRVHVMGALEEPATFETDLGRTFNYPGFLKAKGVSLLVRYPQISIEVQKEPTALGFLYAGKGVFMKSVEQILPEPAAGLGEGLLLGVKRALGAHLEEVFRQAGIIHIVVLSGYNVMIVVEAIMRLLTPLCGPRLRMVFGVSAIFVFAVLVGLSATVVRASIMAALVLIARATGRTYAIMRSLTFAALVMLFMNPYLLVYDPGFQLSFLATLGLILVSPLVEERLGLIPTRFQIREFVTATLATQLMVLPLLLYLMGEFSLVAVLVNVLVLSLVPLAMLGTFVVGITGLVVPSIAILFGYITYLVLQYMVVVATIAVSIPYAAVPVPAFPFIFVAMSYAVLAYILFQIHRRKEKSGEKESASPTSDMSDWIIEEVVPQTKPLDTPSASRSSSSFPFH